PPHYGMPAGHLQVRSYLAVPVVSRSAEVIGGLFFGHPDVGVFTQRAEQIIVAVATQAATAIDNARLYETSEHRRKEFEKAFRGLEATRDVAVAIGGEIALEHVLELIVKRGRALVGARSLVIMLREGHELVVQASAGHAQEMRGTRLPIAESTSGQVLERGRPERITDVAARLRIAPKQFGVADPRTALLVPMLYRGDGVGVLAAFDRGEEGSVFSEDDEQMLRTFAASAATAVALAQSVQADRLSSSLAAADAERRRWARELHDETLQGLGGLRLLLSAARRGNDLGQAQAAMDEAIEHIEREAENLRSIITELRPAALDELGLRTAIEALLDRSRAQSGLRIDGELELPGKENPLDQDLETTVYRLIQEALTNVAKHAHAERVRVKASESDGQLLIEVQDDGRGFDTESISDGFGLSGMRERVSLAEGTLTVDSGKQGTLLKVCLPARHRNAASAKTSKSGSEQLAS
ncbi:MAG: GAF domain-containing protein, partial [Solirubrobacteraceae bacterium]